jgi:hypothetical protein
VYRPRPFDDPFFFSICMHADPLDNTTASMVACLPADPGALAAIGVSLGSPCVGAFLPVWLSARFRRLASVAAIDRQPVVAYADPPRPGRGPARHGPPSAPAGTRSRRRRRDAAEVERAAERQDAPARRALLGAFSGRRSIAGWRSRRRQRGDPLTARGRSPEVPVCASRFGSRRFSAMRRSACLRSSSLSPPVPFLASRRGRVRLRRPRAVRRTRMRSVLSGKGGPAHR